MDNKNETERGQTGWVLEKEMRGQSHNYIQPCVYTGTEGPINTLRDEKANAKEGGNVLVRMKDQQRS